MFAFIKYILRGKKKVNYPDTGTIEYFQSRISEIKKTYKFPRFNKKVVKYLAPIVAPSIALISVVSIAFPAVMMAAIYVGVVAFSTLSLLWLGVAVHDLWQFSHKKFYEHQLEIRNGYTGNLVKFVVFGNKMPEPRAVQEVGSKAELKQEISDIENSYKFKKYGKIAFFYVIPTITPLIALFTSLSLAFPSMGPFTVYGGAILAGSLVLTLSVFAISDVIKLTAKKWLEYKVELMEDVKEIKAPAPEKSTSNKIEPTTKLQELCNNKMPSNLISPDSSQCFVETEILALPCVS